MSQALAGSSFIGLSADPSICKSLVPDAKDVYSDGHVRCKRSQIKLLITITQNSLKGGYT